MSMKGMLALASIALAAALFAGPTAAQAEWTHDHEPLDHHAELTLDGFVHFFSVAGVGSFGCDVHGTLTLDPGHEGQMIAFAPTTETCVGTGAFEGCVPVHDTATVPWDAHANTESGDIIVTDATTLKVYAPGSCAVPSIPGLHQFFPEVTVTPVGDHTTIEQVELSGVDIGGAEVSGTLNVMPAGTYGISAE